MAKKALPRITEPDANLVHYQSHPTAVAVTLCGLFIGSSQGEETTAPVTCIPCRNIVSYIHAHRKPG